MNTLQAFVLILATLLTSCWAMDSGSAAQDRCPINCFISFSQAWAKTIGFGKPTSNMIGKNFMGDNNDIYSIMCYLYADHVDCLNVRCKNASEASNPAKTFIPFAMPKYGDVCTEKQEDFADHSSCLAKNSGTFQKRCESENNDALAAATRLTEQMENGMNDRLMSEYCSALDSQILCELTMVQEFCGFESYDLLRQLMNASFDSIRLIVGDEVLGKVFPTCQALTQTTRNGIPFANVSMTTTTSNVTLESSSSTSTSTSTKTTTSATTSTSTIGSDSTTGAIQKDAADPYKGDNIQTTTHSGTDKVSFNGFSLIGFLISSILVIGFFQ